MQAMESKYFIDLCISFGTGKMFKSKPRKACKMLKKMNKHFKAALNELRKCKLETIGQMSCRLYEAIVYKFGPSNKHQKFWKMALRVYRMLRKLNGQEMMGPFYKFSQKLEKGGCIYQPTKKAVCYLGALLLRRISQLDKLIFLCSRSADLSMGYIELRHMLTFNLMSVAMLSEVSSQALRQINQLTQIYLELSIWFRKHSKRFPSTIDELQQTLAYQIGETNKQTSKIMERRDLAMIRHEIGNPKEPSG